MVVDMVSMTGREVVLKCKLEFLTGYVEFGKKTALVVDAGPAAVMLITVMLDCVIWVDCAPKEELPALLAVA
jgi:hypothetical protein